MRPLFSSQLWWFRQNLCRLRHQQSPFAALNGLKFTACKILAMPNQNSCKSLPELIPSGETRRKVINVRVSARSSNTRFARFLRLEPPDGMEHTELFICKGGSPPQVLQEISEVPDGRR
jgi:hypothetical protein